MASIYLDNAATTHPKPDVVYAAHDLFLRQGGSPGRSAHHIALQASGVVMDARLQVCELLGAAVPERMIFTPGCTYSINMALKGIDWKSGDIVLVSAMEHNAVMRPLRQLELDAGIQVKSVPYAASGIVDPAQLQELIRQERPRLCIFQEASNVSGEQLNIAEVDKICSAEHVPILLDAAQTAGLFNARLDRLQSVAFWCASGHKGLFGAAGVGLLYVRPGFSLSPLIAGGTGSRSEEFDMPVQFPDRMESGTPAGSAIAALGAGVGWLLSNDRAKLAEHELSLARMFIDRFRSDSRLKIIAADCEQRVPTVSFAVEGLDHGRIAEYLDRKYGICVRAGLHCAVSAHRTLGTRTAGLVRAGFGCFNTTDHVELLCDALQEVLNGALDEKTTSDRLR